MLWLIHVYKPLIKTKHISYGVELREQKNPDFYNSKLDGQVTLLSNPLLSII